MLFPPSIDDYLVTTNRPDTLLAAQALNRTSIRTGLMGRMFPALYARTSLLPGNVAAALNTEMLLRLSPSAVFVNGVLAPRLRALGLPALGIVNTGDEQWLIARARLYTDVLGQSARATALLAAYRDQATVITTAVAAATGGRDEMRPRVLMLASFAGALYGYGEHVALGSPLRMAGGRSALGNAAAMRLDRERLLRLDPDVIVLLNVWPARLSRAAFAADPVWRTLRAAGQGRVYRMVPGIEFLPDGLVSWPLLARWLAELLHPDLPATLRDDMRATYLRWTGYAMTDADLDEALAVTDNRGAANAARFERH